MADDFITMTNRIATELRRSNMLAEIRGAINDAIAEGAKTRLYLNEIRGTAFNTVIGQEYYPDLYFTEFDQIYYTQGAIKYEVYPTNDLVMDKLAMGNVSNGQLELYSRQGTSIRFYPIPSIIQPIYLSGFGRLTPYPLVNNADTNNWMTYGERYIRAKAKFILLRDVIRDLGEATAMEAIAEDALTELIGETSLRSTTGTLRSTKF